MDRCASVLRSLAAVMLCVGCSTSPPSSGDAGDAGRADALAGDSGANPDVERRDAIEPDVASPGDARDVAIPGDAPPVAAPCVAGGAVLFCEDFEREQDPAWRLYHGGAGNSDGTIMRDTTRAAAGTASMRANVQYVDNGSGFVELRRDIALPTPDVFVRAWAYLPASAARQALGFAMVYSARGYASLGAGFDDDGHLHVHRWGNVTADGRDPAPFPTDRWVCVEWQLHQGENGAITIWRDDERVIDAVPAAATETLDAFFFGIYGSNNMGSVDLWLDNVAMSRERIGCDRR